MTSIHPVPILAAFGLGGLELLIILGLLGFFAFWLWMIVDCATQEKETGNKIAWIIVLVFVGLIGAPLYFFVRKLSRRNDDDRFAR